MIHHPNIKAHDGIALHVQLTYTCISTEAIMAINGPRGRTDCGFVSMTYFVSIFAYNFCTAYLSCFWRHLLKDFA